jgi:hypothetical protein
MRGTVSAVLVRAHPDQLVPNSVRVCPRVDGVGASQHRRIIGCACACVDRARNLALAGVRSSKGGGRSRCHCGLVHRRPCRVFGGPL